MSAIRKLAMSQLQKKNKRGFRGYPVATIALYGPTNELATKIVVGIVHSRGGDADPLQRWFSENTDVRANQEIGAEVIAFLNEHAPKSVVLADRIIGCPHEEGTDYPAGKSCPKCPFWAGRDRFTHERIQ